MRLTVKRLDGWTSYLARRFTPGSTDNESAKKSWRIVADSSIEYRDSGRFFHLGGIFSFQMLYMV